jgi:hypothetical protein
MAEPERSWLARHWLKVSVSLLIGVGFAALLHAGALPIVPSKEAFAQVRWWTVAAYVGLWSIVHWVRAARWHWLLAPLHAVSMRRIIAVSFVGFFAIVLLPFRTGEVVRPVMIRKRGTLSGWAVMGTIAAERIIDGLMLSVLLLVALIVSTPLDPLPQQIGNLPIPAAVVPGAAYTALAVFAAAFIAMGVYYWRRDFARRLTARVVGWVSPAGAQWLSERVEQVADGLSFLPRARYSVPFVLATALYWLLNAAASWLLAWGVGIDSIDFWEACVCTGVLALGILVPNAPGFFGAFQISVYAAFAMYLPSREVMTTGSAFVFLLYLSQMGITALAGVGGFISEHVGLREALTAEPAELDARSSVEPAAPDVG